MSTNTDNRNDNRTFVHAIVTDPAEQAFANYTIYPREDRIDFAPHALEPVYARTREDALEILGELEYDAVVFDAHECEDGCAIAYTIGDMLIRESPPTAWYGGRR